jgi:capsular polysaccharide biosynthesis protein
MNDMDDAAGPDRSRRAPDRPHVLPAAGPAPWTSEAWNIPDDASEDPGDQARPLASLVSFHYLRAAVRRRWRICALLAVIGVLLGAAFLVATPAPRMATTTLRLTHPEGADPTGAIATDISLLTTRTVAERTISALGLIMRPEDLMNSAKVVPSDSPEILQVTMSAPTEAEAVRRLDTFTKEYLNFRAKQISAQSNIVIKGYKDKIETLQSQARKLGTRIRDFADSGDTATDRLSAAVSEQSQVNNKISSLQATVDEATLRQKAIVLASQVIDRSAPMSPPGGLRRVILVLASGLIGGLAIGFGVVVLRAILSDRLWLRIEVASALDASVLLSVRRITPLSRLLRIVRFLPWVRALDARCAVDLQRMAHAIEKAVPEPGRRQSLAVVCLGNSDEMRFGLVAAAVELQRHGRTATIVDLTEAGGVASALARTAGATVEWTPQVFRPSVIPSLNKGPSHIDSADWEDVALAKGRNGVSLILADLDPGVGVDHLTAWTDCAIVAVTGGKSSAELVRTTGDLVRSVGLQLRGAVLLKAVADDMSSGITTRVGERGTETSEPAVSRPDKSVGRSLKP